MATTGTRPDFSDYLAHFTKDGAAIAGDPITANQRLISILTGKKISAGTLPWTKRPAVCFTECPWSSLLSHAKQYSPYALGFSKPRIFASGGGPAYYVRADHFEKQEWEDHVYTFVTPFWPNYRPSSLKTPPKVGGKAILGGKSIDYSHEREWRIPHDFTFDYAQVEFVILPDYKAMAAFPAGLKDAIGREKFLLLEIYKTIEKLWPVHNI